MSVVHGCGCAPDETIRWLVVALLGVAGVAVLVAGWWLDRRRRLLASPPTGPPPAGDPRSRAERSAPTLAGVLIFGLAIFVAVVRLSSDPALIVLALGATIGTAGIGLGANRKRTDSAATPQ